MIHLDPLHREIPLRSREGSEGKGGGRMKKRTRGGRRDNNILVSLQNPVKLEMPIIRNSLGGFQKYKNWERGPLIWGDS